MPEVALIRDICDADKVHIYTLSRHIHVTTIHIDTIEFLFGEYVAETLIDSDGVTPEWIEISARIKG